MKRFGILTLALLLLSQTGWSQHTADLFGTITDSLNARALNGASIFLYSSDSVEWRFTASDEDGSYRFLAVEPGAYRLKVSYVGYRDRELRLFMSGQSMEKSLGLSHAVETLNEFELVDKVPMATQQGDTVMFNADAFKVNPDATAEDLIKKMPGVVVDGDNVQAQGEDVKKVLVDGRPFFGNDPTLALKTIPAEVIQKIEVFDKLSDQAEFTGFDDGESVKTMNIVTRPEARNGTFGRVYGGYGTDDRYTAGGNMNFFNGDQRISVLGISNNVNQQNFSSEDLLGVMSSGSRQRGGPGGMRGGGRQPGGDQSPTSGAPMGGNANNFMVGPQSGITQTHSAGINYSDKWGDKIELTGSYFFNLSDNASQEYLNRENILPGDSNLFYNEISDSWNKNYNHRFNLKLDYRIDSFNSLLIRPNFSIQGNVYESGVYGLNSLSPQSLISATTNNYNDDSHGYNFDNDMLYRHATRKKGRTISVSMNTGIKKTGSDNKLTALNEYYVSEEGTNDTIYQEGNSDTRSYNLNGRIMYTEPISSSGQFYADYTSSYSKNYALTETYNYDYDLGAYSIFDTTLSSDYDNDYLRNSIGTGLRYNTSKVMMMAGLSLQRSDLVSNPVFPDIGKLDKQYTNILPNAMVRVRFSRSENLRVHLRSNTNAPSLTQLQNVIDNSNPLSVTAGNPDLQQEYSTTLMTRYSLSNIFRSKFMFLMLYLRNTQDYISNATYTAVRDTLIGEGVLLNKGSQLSIPVNMDGYWSARSFFTLGLPVEKIKTNINLNTGVSFLRTPGINNNVNSISQTWAFSQGVVFASNISEKIDFTLSCSATYNVVNNSVQDELDYNYYYQSTGFDFSWIFWKGMVLRNNIKHQFYSGLSEELNDNYFLWNIELGKKFLKNQAAEVKLGVFDLLDQNQSISRNITDTYIEDSSVEVLQRYFMLTFTYNLKAFKQNEDFRPM